MVYNKHLQMVFEWLLERWFNNSVVFLFFLKNHVYLVIGRVMTKEIQ